MVERYILLAEANRDRAQEVLEVLNPMRYLTALAKDKDEALWYAQSIDLSLAIVQTELPISRKPSRRLLERLRDSHEFPWSKRGLSIKDDETLITSSEKYGPSLAKELRDWGYQGPIIGLYSGDHRAAQELWEDKATVLVSNDELREDLGHHIELLLSSIPPLPTRDELTARV